MTVSLYEFLSLLALGGVAWFWFDSLKAREQGIAAVRQACAREGVQLLDETVAGAGLRPVRDDEGRMTLQRSYAFEYSGSGYDRFQGSVTLRGREVVLIDLSAHRGHLRVVQ